MESDDIAAEEADRVDFGANDQWFKGLLEVLDLGQFGQRCWSSGDVECVEVDGRGGAVRAVSILRVGSGQWVTACIQPKAT